MYEHICILSHTYSSIFFLNSPELTHASLVKYVNEVPTCDNSEKAIHTRKKAMSRRCQVCRKRH